ncbi:MAG TPA: hypothetical protein VEO37_05300 [Thermoanaerobaculia bacterium]|nr:hypothetical protein [Thermoanaerobaculia bacterium]
MGRLPDALLEVRLAATLFLLLLGLANLFGAWQVRNFASFTPRGVATAVAQEGRDHAAHDSHGKMGEMPIDLADLDQPRHHIDRQLLVQDFHVHIPVYAITAVLLSGILFGLRLSSRGRVALVLLLFAAPFLDFAGLWGAHLGEAPLFWGSVAVAGGFAMGAAYLIVLAMTLSQCWFRRREKQDA